ncbi:MAG TPA: hypothetical protein VFP68_23145 [Burkholderiaceae bacterium]|nr:hypothetical protein [Burkholderiaceae bacterium]
MVVRSEEEAYALLQNALDGTLPPWAELQFDGWPRLEIYLKGKEFDRSITPPLMRGLLELQKGIYQSYGAAKYDNPTKRLSDEEKKALEIIVRVEGGSTGLDIALSSARSGAGQADRRKDELDGHRDRRHHFPGPVLRDFSAPHLSGTQKRGATA